MSHPKAYHPQTIMKDEPGRRKGEARENINVEEKPTSEKEKLEVCSVCFTAWESN